MWPYVMGFLATLFTCSLFSYYCMSYSCSTCDESFESAVGVTQHVALHHNTCAACDESFDNVDGLRDHVHSSH